MAPGKKRSYQEASIEKPQCVLCSKVLSAESMKPNKLKEHFEISHVEFAEKDMELFKRKERILYSTHIDSTGHVAQINEAVLEASYRIALRIAECKKPHTIGEKFIKPCHVEATKLILGMNKQERLTIYHFRTQLCEA